MKKNQIVMSWLVSFVRDIDRIVASGRVSWTALANEFVQLGVQAPESTSRWAMPSQDGWFEGNQVLYNRMVYNILVHRGLIGGLRRCLLKDLNGSDYQPKTGWKPGEDKEWAKNCGQIAHRDYAREVLANFLWLNRAKVKWI